MNKSYSMGVYLSPALGEPGAPELKLMPDLEACLFFVKAAGFNTTVVRTDGLSRHYDERANRATIGTVADLMAEHPDLLEAWR